MSSLKKSDYKFSDMSNYIFPSICSLGVITLRSGQTGTDLPYLVLFTRPAQ